MLLGGGEGGRIGRVPFFFSRHQFGAGLQKERRGHSAPQARVARQPAREGPQKAIDRVADRALSAARPTAACRSGGFSERAERK